MNDMIGTYTSAEKKIIFKQMNTTLMSIRDLLLKTFKKKKILTTKFK